MYPEQNPEPDSLPDFIVIPYSVCTYTRPEPQRDAVVFKTPDKTLGGMTLDKGLSYIGVDYTITLSNSPETRLIFDFLYRLGYERGMKLVLRHEDNYINDWYELQPIEVNTSQQNPVFSYKIVNDFNREVSVVADNGLYFNLTVQTLLDGQSFDLISRDFEYMLLNAGSRAIYGFNGCGIRYIDIYKGAQATSFAEVDARDDDILMSLNIFDNPTLWAGQAIASGTATWIVLRSFLVDSCSGGSVYRGHAAGIGSISMLNLNGSNETNIVDTTNYTQSALVMSLDISTVDSSAVLADTAEQVLINQGYNAVTTNKNYSIYQGTIPATTDDIATRDSDLLCEIKDESGEVRQGGAAGWLAVSGIDEQPLLMCGYSQGTIDLQDGELAIGQMLTAKSLKATVAEPVDPDTELSYLVTQTVIIPMVRTFF